mgnify:CR=1 FL=1
MNYLKDATQTLLRNAGQIDKNEIVAKEADLFVAVNIVNQTRRILNISGRILEAVNLAESGMIKNESKKRILKG